MNEQEFSRYECLFGTLTVATFDHMFRLLECLLVYIVKVVAALIFHSDL
jgi:hypothetical protein